MRLESTIHQFRLTSETRTYSEIEARNTYFDRWLSEYIPRGYENAIIHINPNFEHFTYGDAIDTSKGVQISKLKENDYIFFVASLAPCVKEAYAGRDKGLIRYYQKGNMAKFVIGYFKVQATYLADKTPDDHSPLLYTPPSSESVRDRIDEDTLDRIMNNAYTKRDEDHYCIVIGNPSNSAFFKRALKLTENGSPFRPSKIGEETYGNVGFPRGFKWVRDPSHVQNLLNYCSSCL